MRLIHASLATYAPGQVITATPTATAGSFYPLAVPALEATRPSGAPSRETCVFAADDPGFCYFFALRQWPGQTISLYEVEMDLAYSAPMPIVHVLQRRLEKGEPAEALTSEYWAPTKPWRFNEYFGPSFEVVGPIAAPAINEIVLFMAYDAEVDRARQL